MTYQNHLIVYFKGVNCMLYELHLNKAVLKKEKRLNGIGHKKEERVTTWYLP